MDPRKVLHVFEYAACYALIPYPLARHKCSDQVDEADYDGFWDEPLPVFLREYEKAKGDTEWQVVYHYAP